MAGHLFELHRDRDPSGVSGTGVVADGVEFPDGTVVIRWRGERGSTVVWSDIRDVEAIHGHGGATRIVWREEESWPESDSTESSSPSPSPPAATTS